LLFLAMVAGLAACAPDTSETYRDVVVDYSDRPAGELVDGFKVSQSFVSNHDRLCAVAVAMATYAGRAKGCEVVFRLRAEKSVNDIHVQRVPCAEIADNSLVRFDFKPLDATRGQRFVFSLESPDAQPMDAATALMASIPNIYPDGVLSVNDEPVPGALCFTSFHAAPGWLGR
jgi:hypothetical protein